jgi:hypothetical protein
MCYDEGPPLQFKRGDVCIFEGVCRIRPTATKGSRGHQADTQRRLWWYVEEKRGRATVGQNEIQRSPVCRSREKATLNAKNLPDVGKGDGDRAALSDDEADTERSEWRGGLNVHRGNAGIRSGQLWGEYLACYRAHVPEAHADERRDDHVEAHAQRDPRYAKLGDFSVQQERVWQSALDDGDDHQDCRESTMSRARQVRKKTHWRKLGI